MASQFSLHISHLSSVESFESEDSIRYKSSSSHISELKTKYGLSKNNPLCRFLSRRTPLSQSNSVRRYIPKVLSAISSSDTDQTNVEAEQPVAMANSLEIECNRINCLVWVLHESARSFSVAIQKLKLTRRDPELAMAWVGIDVHSWHKKIAYQVAVYALLKAAIEVELFLSHKRSTNASVSVSEILYTTTSTLEECIESQLTSRSPQLVHWFKTVEMPRIAGLFIPLFKKWSLDYAGSGVAGIILAISCCTAVRKLGSGRLSCPSLSESIEDILVKLMNLSYSLVSVDKLHHLAREAGFEEDFLLHFGSKILPSKNTENMEFWIGLVRAKLSEAFHRESVISGKQAFCDKDQENNLSILGLFAYLGRETRLFISRMKIKDLDEQVVDFLSYLECGTLFIYPKFSSLREYQLFMEVVTDEIGWLDFYAEYYCKFYQGRRRSKQHKIQAEKEIILHTVFTVCYDVFSGFAHYSNSTQQPLDSNLLAFLLRSQSLLSICLEDYWAAYDRSGTSEHMKNLEGAQWKPIDFRKRGSEQHGSEVTKTAQIRQGLIPESKSLYGSLLSKSSSKLISASTAIWMGTQLLCVDVLVSLKLFMKQLLGKKVTEREKKKIDKTLADIATLIPVTILMLIPVSAVGHAAMLTAIKRYIPALIPSPYCSERLNMVKQLKRTKKMEIQAWSNIEDNAMFGEGSREVKEGSCLSGSKMHEEDNGSRKTEVQS
ncbi:uncharacterized protein LOC108209095 [Daucus carota subsp. sativus]|uniref:uncharacterized protein LOC108209095 n=1 Tax=Daucus carota subsp. sativus TaxID=79200 RepID=UPI0007F0010B|nr:PREDICTED: uncharacterized protein LOC108209095 [Daucus carota subsp. sativus]